MARLSVTVMTDVIPVTIMAKVFDSWPHGDRMTAMGKGAA